MSLGLLFCSVIRFKTVPIMNYANPQIHDEFVVIYLFVRLFKFDVALSGMTNYSIILYDNIYKFDQQTVCSSTDRQSHVGIVCPFKILEMPI